VERFPLKPTVAWIGLGTMGAPMAGHVLRAGFPLVVWNRTTERARPLEALGARVAGSPAEAVEAAEISVVMLSSPEAFEFVLSCESGILEGIRDGSLVVDVGTDGAAAARRAASLCARKGAAFIDAPVLGSRAPAEQGKLVVMAGGPAEDVARARPVLESFARSVRHVGPVGAGQTMKLASNLVLGHMLTSLAGALALAKASGLDATELVEILETGLGSPFFRAKGVPMILGTFEPQFTLDLARKDTRLIRAALDEAGMAFPTIGPILGMFDEAARRGWGREDGAAVVKLWMQHGSEPEG